MNSIAEWFQTHILKRDLKSTEIIDFDNVSAWSDPACEMYVRELAFWSCANTVANAISKCKFKTFVDGDEIKGDEYYLWNVSPNDNQCSSEFIHQWISQLYLRNEALVIDQNGKLLVADSFNVKEYALYENIFSQVTIGDYTFNKTFTSSEVLYFRLSNKNMRDVMNGLYAAYQKLINYGMESYTKSRGSHGILKMKAFMPGDAAAKTNTMNSLKNGFKNFFAEESSVMPLDDKTEYTELSQKTYSNEATRDIRSMIDDVSDFTARAFGIPPELLNGKVAGTENAVNYFLTFCIDPLVDMLECEINKKRYGKKEFLNGNYIRIDTKAIKHIDLLDVAVSIDKIIASGAFCVNDIREVTGEQIIDEPWAWQHFMTKNYSTVEDLLESLGESPGVGGEKT